MFWFFDFFSFLSETHLSYLAWSWFFFWFWASADSKFFFFFISFVYSTLVYFFILSKYPFLVSPSLFLSVHLVGNVHIPPLPFLPLSTSTSQSVSQSVSALRSIPSTLQHEFYFSCVFLSSHTYPNSRRFEVSYSNFVCVLSIISFVLSTLYLDGRKGFF